MRLKKTKKFSIGEPSTLVPRGRRSRKKKATLGVFLLIALISGYLLAAPYLPRLYYLIFRPKINAAPLHDAVEKKSTTPTTDTQKPGNRLILPEIGLDAQIIEGKNIYVIGKNQGIWHETSTTNPSKPGNIVLAGHRFLYTATNGGLFYNLPELKKDDLIYIKWDNVLYEYQVFNTRSVLPTQTDVRDADPNVPHKLTMYTCYPLGSTAQRFVVEAKLLL